MFVYPFRFSLVFNYNFMRVVSLLFGYCSLSSNTVTLITQFSPVYNLCNQNVIIFSASFSLKVAYNSFARWALTRFRIVYVPIFGAMQLYSYYVHTSRGNNSSFVFASLFSSIYRNKFRGILVFLIFILVGRCCSAYNRWNVSGARFIQNAMCYRLNCSLCKWIDNERIEFTLFFCFAWLSDDRRCFDVLP